MQHDPSKVVTSLLLSSLTLAATYCVGSAIVTLNRRFQPMSPPDVNLTAVAGEFPLTCNDLREEFQQKNTDLNPSKGNTIYWNVEPEEQSCYDLNRFYQILELVVKMGVFPPNQFAAISEQLITNARPLFIQNAAIALKRTYQRHPEEIPNELCEVFKETYETMQDTLTEQGWPMSKELEQKLDCNLRAA